MGKQSRRQFLKAGAGVAAFTIVSNTVLGKAFGHTAPSDKLNIAGIGVGGMGRRNLANMKTENIVALCDVDWRYAAKTFNDYPGAKRFKDWRTMLDEMGKSIDAIMVATPDHTHAGVAAHAMTLGKHAYVQKPLAFTVYESRLLAKLAKKYKVATQMGNQGNSRDGCRIGAEMIKSGIIGDVKEVHCWTDRPIWPQGLEPSDKKFEVPATLDWDLFLGPAQKRDYNPAYTPWNWRGWWDFGTGALGDMACHIMDPIYWALDLKYPVKVQGSSTLVNLYSPPHAEIVEYVYPARTAIGRNNMKIKMPEVKITWYDGGLLPKRPAELLDSEAWGKGNGVLYIGSKGKILTDVYGTNPRLLPTAKMKDYKAPTPWIPRIKDGDGDLWKTNAHEQDWIRACKESPGSRKESTSHFGFSGPFNEAVVMGVLAVRLQQLDRILQWDSENMRFTNISDTDKLKIVTLNDFKVVDGDPKFTKKYADFNAGEMAKEWIKRTYHNGFTLPPMPV